MGANLPSERAPQRGWGLRSTLCKRSRSLLGIAGKRESSFIRAANEMSFAIRFHRRHVADCSTPGCHRLAQRGAALERVWGMGDTHKSIKTRPPLPQSSGALLFPWVLWPGEVARQRPGTGTHLSCGVWPQKYPRIFVFPLTTYLCPSQGPAALSTPAGLSDAAQILFSTLPPLPAPSPLLHPFPISERSSAVVSRFN